LTEEEYKQVFDIDYTILYYEFAELMGERDDEDPALYSKPEFECRGFAEVEQEFWGYFDRY